MDLKQLQTFLTTVDLGSISRAAAVLHLAQPSLSRQIALLEEELDQRLLIRTGRGVMPTEAGEILREHARVMLDQAMRTRQALRDLSVHPTGRVVIGLPPRVAVAIAVPLVQQFRETFPKASVTVIEGLSLSLREQLLSGRLDFALLYDPLPSPKLDLEDLVRDPLVLVAPAAMSLPPRVTLSDLQTYPMVLPSAPNALRSLVDAALQPHQLSLTVVAEVGAVQTALALVAAGVGATILPKSGLAATPPEAQLQVAEITPDIHSHLRLAMVRNTPVSRLTKATIAMTKALVQG